MFPYYFSLPFGVLTKRNKTDRPPKGWRGHQPIKEKISICHNTFFGPRRVFLPSFVKRKVSAQGLPAAQGLARKNLEGWTDLFAS